MRKLIVTEFVSLDGVMDAPGGEPGYRHSGWTMDFPSPSRLSSVVPRGSVTASATLLPAGPAWLAAWRRVPKLRLYGPDGFHPSVLRRAAADALR